MSACPPDEALAQLASEPDAEVAAHASECMRCRGLLVEQRAMRTIAARLVPPTLERSRRAALAAEIMARADLAMPEATEQTEETEETDVLPRKRRWGVAVAGLAAAAAAITVVQLSRGPAEVAAPSVPVALPSRVEPPVIVVAPEPAPPVIAAAPPETAPAPRVRPRNATVTGAAAEFARVERDGDDTVQLREGELAIDSVAARAVRIVAGETHVEVARARVAVKAHRGVIQTVTVIAGSAWVVAAGKRHVIEAGMTWERPVVSASPAQASLSAFREGWTALREGRHREAITAFERATDPVVAEDAAYWTAVASERAGAPTDAADRYAAFATRFPASPRAATAIAAAERLRATR